MSFDHTPSSKTHSDRKFKTASLCLALAAFAAAPSAGLRFSSAQAADVIYAAVQDESMQLTPKAAYDRGNQLFKEKKYAEARPYFEQARDGGYKPGWFQPSANDMLNKISKAEADAAAAATAAENARKSGEAKTAYATARKNIQDKNWAEARKNLEFARDNGYKPGWFEPSVYSLLAEVDKNDVPAPAAQTTPPPTEPAPAQGNTLPPVAETPAPAAQTPSAAATPADKAIEATANLDRIRTQQRQYEANRKVEEARRAADDNRLADALKLYTDATELDPNNAVAAAGREEVAQRLGRPLVGTSGIVGVERNIRVKIQQIEYKFNDSIDRANAAIDRSDFAAAQTAIESARVARATDPGLFNTATLGNMDARIATAEARLNQARALKEESDRARANEQATIDQRRRADDEERQRRATVGSLISQAQQLINERKFSEALGVVDHILAVDPKNQYAIGVRQLIVDQAHIQEQRKYIEQKDEEQVRHLVAGQEKLIPYFDILNYASNWPEISAMRDRQLKEERGESDTDQAMQALLDRKLPELPFNGTNFVDVIDYLREVTGANIYVDWAALERASISKDATVTTKLRDIKFSKALDLIFRSVSGEEPDRRLGYTIDEGVLTISTKKELDKNVLTRQYDINDLLFVAPDFTGAPQFNLQNTGSAGRRGGSGGGGGGGGGGGQGGGLFGGQQQGGQGQGQDAKTGASREELIDEIKKSIQDNVATTTWKDNGGEVGSISTSKLRSVLLVTQTPENHREISKLLENLRKTQAIQISVETRFLTVQRNYLEDIGVDADFTFNGFYRDASGTPNPSLGRTWSNRFSTIGFDQKQVTDNGSFVDPTTGQVTNSSNGVRVLDWASRVGNAAVPGSIPANGGDYPEPLVIRGSFLDNFTVNFLIRAVEANQHTTQLTAPRITIWDGQRSWIAVSSQQAYVSDLTPVVSSGAALFDPEPDVLDSSGVVLDVQATVSPDRKYVYMTLRPTLSRLRQLVSFSTSAVVQPTATVTTPGGVAQSAQTVTGSFQLPTLDIVQMQTTCSVPDGATLLLGGQTLAGETDREHGVPILSKIPFLKRLFTNRASAQDEQILLILVKPTILIAREQEQKQFPQIGKR